MRRKALMLLGVFVLLAITVVPAFAVTDGELDGDGHPMVVLLLMDVGGQPAFRCSGTLLSSRVLLTAGHCTNNFPDAPYTGMRVFIESDVQAGIGSTNSYPTCAIGHGTTCFEAVDWAAHPDYETAPFFVNDVGVVILEAPGVNLAAYGSLPAVDQFDALKTRRGHNSNDFTAVGYGLQESFPDAASWKEHNTRTRYVAHPHLIQVNGGIVGDFSLLLSNNHHTGGTCFGDSGGANFVGDSLVVGGITSFGLNGNCAGTGGVFRTDRQNVQDFIYDFAGAYLP